MLRDHNATLARLSLAGCGWAPAARGARRSPSGVACCSVGDDGAIRVADALASDSCRIEWLDMQVAPRRAADVDSPAVGARASAAQPRRVRRRGGQSDAGGTNKRRIVGQRQLAL